ncbi:MAG: hypothetical protein IGS49_11290 [Chlorogloeopsis fritschii C42_A2020_084]|jgi:hypothetical protein|nr:hypothetical protein [Chlorogloeopsis fritschii C42_A2020_084]
MPKTSSLDVIMQQLDALSLAELLKVRAKVNALIKGKSLPLSNNFIAGSYQRVTFVSNDEKDIDISVILENIRRSQLNEDKVVQCSELETKKDDSLKKVIELVDEWMDDQSGYDEEAYPQLRQL